MSQTTQAGFNLGAEDLDIEGIMEGSAQLRVPDYQREYSWHRDQWETLWDDLYALTQERENHFLGSIVVIERRGEELKKLDLVDGQQRLTTISILLCAIRDRFEQEDLDEYERVPGLIENFLWIRSNVTGDKHQKLKLNTFHNPDFKAILEGNHDTIEDSQLKDAYDFYRGKIDSISPDRAEDIRRKLIQDVSIVQIDCGSEFSAFRLFESLNDKGLDLGAVDLVKNRLFMEANEVESIDEDRVKSLWESIMETIRPELNQNYRFFCHYFMSLSKPEARDNVSKRKLHNHVDQLLETDLEQHGIAVEELLEDMYDKAKLYTQIVNCSISGGFEASKLRDINQKLESAQLKNNRIRTLLLKIIDTYDDTDEVLEALHILEVFNIRDKIAGRDSNTSRDRFWSRACSVMEDRSDKNEYLRGLLKKRAPNDTVLEERMLNREFKRNDFTKYVLDRIEEQHYMRSGGQAKTVSDRSVVDIEHIAPERVWQANNRIRPPHQKNAPGARFRIEKFEGCPCSHSYS